MLILLALIAIATGAFLVNTFGVSDHLESRERRTEAALAQAKEALIFFAASYTDLYPAEVPGYLPCPDISAAGTEGVADTGTVACTSKDVTAIGRLPWQTLGMPAPRDASGECLWYVVSGNFKANLNKTDLMNWDTNGLITVRGRMGHVVALGNVPSGAVAIIFAPGPAIAGQTRAAAVPSICGGNYAAANYLDSADGVNNAVTSPGANVINTFTAAAPSPTFNDRLIFITAKEIFDAIERRQHVDPENLAGLRLNFADLLGKVTQRTAECIARYPTLSPGYVVSLDRRLQATTELPFPSNNYGADNNYLGVSGRYFGRAPDNQLSVANCPGWDRIDPWWKNWKDHLFYAVSRDFSTEAGVGVTTNTSCTGGNCVRLFSSTTEYAGIVMFAGKRLGTQERDNVFHSPTSADKGNINNYLESDNAIASIDGRGSYRTGAATSIFNDRLFGIRQDLTVTCFADSGSETPCPP